MDNLILVVLCGILLVAYLIDVSSAYTRIPSVLAFFLLGWISKQVINYSNIQLPDLSQLLPILGILGLVLVVLEGALDIEINAHKVYLLGKSLLFSILTLLMLWILLSLAFYIAGSTSFRTNLINALPFCVISSAIAIPSVQKLSGNLREFVMFESSFSDILGVLIFNFLLLNNEITSSAVLHFSGDIVLITIISFVSILLLAILLGKIKHHISYTPIILLVLLVYAISKLFHLPSLLFVLVFGLFLANIKSLESYSWFKRLNPSNLRKESEKFKLITHELTFLVRSLFFILFGYLMKSSDILSLESLPWSLGIILLLLFVRWLVLKVMKLENNPLLLIAPRGLITILLFLNIPKESSFPIVNDSLIIQTVLLSVIIMSIGLFKHNLKKPELSYESSFFS
ncbi:MAG: sodium:proton antiporter [Bacteroidales bacterium]|nr:sodium:proton antiporter [Bacteroidales bacterium]